MSLPEDGLIPFYRSRIKTHGFSYEAMWGDNAAWKSDERFKPLLALPIQPGDRIVDIGCGIGDLFRFFEEHFPGVEYVGVEAVPDFAAAARERTGAMIIEQDAFSDPDSLPEADWYITFGTLNKTWGLEALPGKNYVDQILGLTERLFLAARKGVAITLVTDVVDYHKPGVCNMNPAHVLDRLRQWTPMFALHHGYPFYEFFAAAWRGERR